MADEDTPKEIDNSHLTTKLSLEDLALLTPDIRQELIENFGLEVHINSSSDKVKELLAKAGVSPSPTAAAYDKFYDRTTPGYDRIYDRGKL